VDLQSKIPLAKEQNIVAGLDIGRDQLKSDMIPRRQRLDRYGYYVNYLVNIGTTYNINVGARYDDNEAFGNQFSPSAGVAYHLPYWTTHLRISYARAFNTPPLIYKYLNPNVNPELKAERAPAVYEFSVETKPINPLSLKFATYRAEVNNLVVYNWAKGIPENIGKTRRQGIESEIKYNLIKGLHLSGGYAINRIEDRITGQIIQSSEAARVTYNLGLNYHFQDKLNFNIKGNYRFWNEAITSKPNDRKFIWDARANYDFNPQATVFISVFNILNSKYWWNELLPLPGREVEVGLRYSF